MVDLRRRPSGIMLAAFLFCLVMGGCGTDQPQPSSTGDDEYARAYGGLCRARAEVEGDVGRARDIFFAESHTALHRLADETTERDRNLAAQLLEAKNRTEAALGASATEAASSLDDLLRVSRQALISLGVPQPPCD